MSGRAVPYHCPFCAEEDLVPYEDPQEEVKSGWHCYSCSRVFTVRFHGLAAPAPIEDPLAAVPHD